MPVKGWKAVGVSVREEEYPILMERLRGLGFNSLQQLVKTLINEGFTSNNGGFTSKKEVPFLQTNGVSNGKLWAGSDLNRRPPPRKGGILPD